MDQKKTATDVLIEHGEKLDTILQLLQNLDFTQKLLSSQLKGLIEAFNSNKVNSTPTVQTSNTALPNFVKNMVPAGVTPEVQASEAPKKNKGGRPTNAERSSKPEPVIFPPTEIESNITTGTIVQQTVLKEEDGKTKPVFMAAVHVKDKDNKVVATSRTNAIGNWQAVLPPGTYYVLIKKASDSLQKSIELNDKIEVVGTKPIKLPDAIYKQ